LQLEQHKDKLSDLKATKSADWGSQIRNYVLHPYTLVKDTRTGHESHDAQKVLDGELDSFMHSYLSTTL
jgi:peptide chain release factor 2